MIQPLLALAVLIAAVPQEKAGSLKLEPSKLDFGELARGAKKVENVKLLNTGKNDVRLMSIGELGKGVYARVLDEQGEELLGSDGKSRSWNRLVLAGKSLVLEVTVEAITPANALRRRITLYTDEPGATKVQLPVSFTIAGPSPEAAAAETKPQPVLWAQADSIEFGTMLSGAEAKRPVMLQNKGDADLVISKVKASCGCTVTRLVTREGPITPDELEARSGILLKPKETASLEAELVSKGLYGEVLKEIMITSNDPRQPTKQIEVRAHLEAGFLVQPTAFYFDKVTQGQAATKSVNVLVSQLLPRLEVTEAVPPAEGVKVTFTRLEGAGLGYHVECTLPADASASTLKAPVTLKTNDPLVKEIVIPVVGEMSYTVLFDTGNAKTPDRLDFGYLKPGEGAVRDVQIDNLEPEVPYQVDHVELDSRLASLIKHELITVEPGKKYRLRITVSPDTPKGHFTGTLTVVSPHKKLPRKELKILGFVGVQ